MTGCHRDPGTPCTCQRPIKSSCQAQLESYMSCVKPKPAQLCLPSDTLSPQVNHVHTHKLGSGKLMKRASQRLAPLAMMGIPYQFDLVCLWLLGPTGFKSQWSTGKIGVLQAPQNSRRNPNRNPRKLEQPEGTQNYH